MSALLDDVAVALHGRWLPGMATWEGRRYLGKDADGTYWSEPVERLTYSTTTEVGQQACSMAPFRVVPGLREASMVSALYPRPDLDDHCTVGGLAQLTIRAVSRELGLDLNAIRRGDLWIVHRGDEPICVGTSLGTAWARAFLWASRWAMDS